ncbi:hypothetical protein [Paenibacillus oryzisoli]|uniref:Uncharacterized protein n=1 Tax=Paenibacillus oryzisoli TaxID=1850517 RepID=A0A198AJ91_9BACL|nr:hypothetical protein [Paenibacillus oryzisoli]OAS21140.1 hypothetical protein A8708_30075 [Paenibacillus oryzisoli]
MKFRVNTEYVDRTLGQRVHVGEEIELSAERVNTIQALGVRLEPIAEGPEVKTATAPKVEKAVSNRGNKRT